MRHKEEQRRAAARLLILLIIAQALLLLLFKALYSTSAGDQDLIKHNRREELLSLLNLNFLLKGKEIISFVFLFD